MSRLVKVPLEADEQAVVIQYLDIKKLDYHSVPNGVWLPNPHPKGSTSYILQARYNKIAIAKLYKEGLTSGVSDLVIFCKYKILYLELKRVIGGVKSKDQLICQSAVNKYPYAEYHFAKGAKEAISIIERMNKRG